MSNLIRLEAGFSEQFYVFTDFYTILPILAICEDFCLIQQGKFKDAGVLYAEPVRK